MKIKVKMNNLTSYVFDVKTDKLETAVTGKTFLGLPDKPFYFGIDLSTSQPTEVCVVNSQISSVQKLVDDNLD